MPLTALYCPSAKALTSTMTYKDTALQLQTAPNNPKENFQTFHYPLNAVTVKCHMAKIDRIDNKH